MMGGSVSINPRMPTKVPVSSGIVGCKQTGEELAMEGKGFCWIVF